MTRLYIFAEGQTEQTYGDTVLKKHLAAFGVYVQGPILIAHARKKGVTHRGGGRRYLPMKNDILRFLQQEKGQDVFFTTMIDLYALPVDFPGTSETEQLRHLPYDRVSNLEKNFAADIEDPWGRPTRFIPHIQLHEFEAILLCRPAAFASFFENCRQQIERLEANIQGKPPELIDDGQHTAPSKRIIEQFPDYEGAKSAAGPRIAEEIGIECVRDRCRHFGAWLKTLESLSNRPQTNG
jgi:hypothetical protein